MDNFRDFITEQKNTHMTHLEDRVLYGGVKGTREAIFALRDLRDMLKGHGSGSKVSVKWDGAPAIFAGIDPRDGKFFVAKKGIFNKNPKVYKTNSDIEEDTSGDLADKLKLALKYLPSLGIKGVIQGDFLFSNSDLKVKRINLDSYLTFHPNTIIYAIPMRDKETVNKIKRSKIGIVWHTTYKGSSFETMKADYGVNVDALKDSPDVFSQDAMLRDLSKYSMSDRETEEVNKYLREAGVIFNKISGNALRQIENNPILSQHIEQFNNSFVRQGTIIRNTSQHVQKLIRWIEEKYQKEADKRKTDKGKKVQLDKRDSLLSFFSKDNMVSLKYIFDLQKLLVLAKLKLINTFNRLKKIGTFVKTRDGYKITGHEGYVAIDQLGGGAVKIIDRMEFSYNNFNPNVVKGWDKPGRN